MRLLLAGCLMVLSLWLSQRANADTWRAVVRPASIPPPAAPSSVEGPMVTLGRPEAINRPAVSQDNQGSSSDRTIVPVGYESTERTLSSPIIRGQSPEQASPTLAPPPGGGFPASPEERYNAGVVTNNGPIGSNGGGGGFWGQCQDIFNNCGQAM